ncbi:putative bifunctional diguanylate cyclase/phosphodiesterase [Paenibacillus thalictri]|uniref:putative bifunctional diguanylate cyclase/phosphodiesterase n=1 Tax=Paenibacillus thalictri TaxID=2527873 RepID=UPI0013EF25C3|nr:EAL domain-containing protein [Paenibacillus thalictri]
MLQSGHYNLPLVVLSFVVSLVSSFIALDMARRVMQSQGSARKIWLIGGALVMGIGIWGMHFIAMLAYRMDYLVVYDIKMIVLSVIVAIAASFFALSLAGLPVIRKYELAGGALLMGLAISGMHYTGMAAATMMPQSLDQAAVPSLDGNILGVAIAFGTLILLGVTLIDRQLAHQTAFKGSILESAIDSIMMFDHRKRIIEFNPAAERIFNRRREDMIGRPLELVLDVAAILKEKRKVEGMDEDPIQSILGQRLETLAFHADGTLIPVELTVTRVKIEGELLYTAYLRDITERVRSENLIKEMAYHDMLTGLPNRNGFNSIAVKLFDYAAAVNKTVAMLFVDLDRFKLINDTLGHQAGDMLLQAFSQRLKKCVRESDTVSRLGGDEFLLLLPGATPNCAAKIAQRMVAAMTEPFILGGQTVFVTSSIGITMFPADGENLETLVRHADTAMNAAKEWGKDTYRFYESQMNEATSRKMELEQSLRKALEHNEFVLYYQPKYNLLTGKAFGVEALVRWRHPKLGIVPPSEFIPLAEETGLIVPLGDWILRTACMQNQKWINEGLPAMRMAVNLSMLQISQDNLVEWVQNALDYSGMDPDYLELEITESIAILNEYGIERKLHALRAMGIRISVDDFGTGYSSLSRLNQLPIDTLKIDRSFIRDIASSEESSVILKAIIYMARSLNLTVLAEGVETEEQLRFLQKHLCMEGQGYYFNKPLSVEDMERQLMIWGPA